MISYLRDYDTVNTYKSERIEIAAKKSSAGLRPAFVQKGETTNKILELFNFPCLLFYS
jgi:hypothetical protein